LHLIQVSNIRQALVELKKQGFHCIGLDQDGKNHSASKSEKIAIVVGSEANGLQDIVRRECDEILTLKTSKDFNVLNASVAAAIAMYINSGQ
jgi:23S rRNA (guanosine2251-2'-O)-methyltransferase